VFPPKTAPNRESRITAERFQLRNRAGRRDHCAFSAATGAVSPSSSSEPRFGLQSGPALIGMHILKGQG